MALTFLQAAQSLLQQVQQNISLGESSMDIDEDDEPPSGSLSAQPGAVVPAHMQLCQGFNDSASIENSLAADCCQEGMRPVGRLSILLQTAVC